MCHFQVVVLMHIPIENWLKLLSLSFIIFPSPLFPSTFFCSIVILVKYLCALYSFNSKHFLQRSFNMIISLMCMKIYNNRFSKNDKTAIHLSAPQQSTFRFDFALIGCATNRQKGNISPNQIAFDFHAFLKCIHLALTKQ